MLKNLFGQASKVTRPLVQKGVVSANRKIPSGIKLPEYAYTGRVPSSPPNVVLHDDIMIPKLRKAGRLARKMVEYALAQARPGVTTDFVDKMTCDEIIKNNAYPSPINYGGFPKAICTSVNEVVCHGIPDDRVLQYGDILSIDVSLYTDDGVHGDNCRTIIVGVTGVENSNEETQDIEAAKKLVQTNMDVLEAAIKVCEAGNCLSDIGYTIESETKKQGFSVVNHFCGHGVGHLMHMAPFVLHHKNNEKMKLQPGMCFTIEPIIVEGDGNNLELWEDNWTAVTADNSRASQFEHQLVITESGPAEVFTRLE